MIHVHGTVSISRSVDQIAECVEVLHARGEFNTFVELGVYVDDFQILLRLSSPNFPSGFAVLFFT